MSNFATQIRYKMHRIVNIIIFFTLLVIMQSCFTGIESTPRITSSDVSKEHIILTKEQQFMSDITPEPPIEWREGKRFYVTDSKISLVLSSDTPIDTTFLVGSDLVLTDIVPSISLTGDEIAVVEFISTKGQKLNYKTQIPYSELGQKTEIDIPFAIDKDLVDKVAARMLGHTYYITTPMWYDEYGQQLQTGLRHVAINVNEIRPGNSNYPILVIFNEIGKQENHSVYMTIGNRRTATRNFDTLFAFDNPKNKYQHISDENWQLITHAKVKLGMTKDECRLALGAPTTIGQRPTTAGMVEYWSYADGIHLIFEDGYLATYRR